MAIIAKFDKGNGRPRRLRYIQTLPTLCTLGNVLCGFGAIQLCMRATFLAGGQTNPATDITLDSAVLERMLPSHIVMAAYLLFMAMIFDALDGRLARWTRHTTDFGAQLDSLADVVSFCLAPAVIILALLTRQISTVEFITPFSETIFARLAWLMAAVYVACGVLRLARFNVENEPVEQAHQTFRGLPSPGAAGAIAALVILHDHLYFYDRSVAKAMTEQGGSFSEWLVLVLPFAALLLGLLMVSRFRYPHLINEYLRRRWAIPDVVKFLIAIGLVVLYLEITLAVVLAIYAVSGPAVALVAKMRRNDVPAEEPVDAAAPSADPPPTSEHDIG